MEMCRACLSFDNDMVALDEEFIFNYNLLTQLDISIFDKFPQHVCNSCNDTVKLFLEFKEKCVKSENTLHNIKNEKVYNSADTELRKEDNIMIGDPKIKIEIFKDESNSADDFYRSVIFEGFNDGIENVVKDEDIKVVKRKLRNASTIKRETYFKSNKRTSKLRRVKKNKVNLTTELKNPTSCGLCKQTFLDTTILFAHLERHKTDKTCGLCYEQFKSWPQMLSHRVVHTELCVCHVCSRKCITPVALEYHYLKNHYEGQNRRLQCKQCNFSFETPKLLSRHVYSSHSTRRFICDHCSKIFNTKSRIHSHMKMHSTLKTYQCDICDFTCRYSQGIKSHKVTHSENKVICRKCCTYFADQEDCDKHRCKEKTIVCPICGKVYKTSSKYSRHMKIHSEIGTYKCERCPAVYKSRAALKVHINRHDGNRTHQCEYCTRNFYSHSVLIKHRRIHTGERPYVCKTCQRGFTGRHNLKVHMKVHGEDLIIKKIKTDDLNVTLT